MAEVVETFNEGDVVSLFDGKARGVVKFFGITAFANGEWVGIELEKPAGKNNGTVMGKAYFHCAPNHGVFVRPGMISKMASVESPVAEIPIVGSPGKPRRRSVVGSTRRSVVGSTKIKRKIKVDPGDEHKTIPQAINRQSTPDSPVVDPCVSDEHKMSPRIAKKKGVQLNPVGDPDAGVGNEIIVSGHVGVIRFCGETAFAEGMWTGVEFSEPVGRNDGSFQGVKYFTCPENHGIFMQPILRQSSADDGNLCREEEEAGNLETESSSARTKKVRYRKRMSTRSVSSAIITSEDPRSALDLEHIPPVEDDPDSLATTCETLSEVEEALADIDAARIALRQRLSEAGARESLLRTELIRAHLLAKKSDLRASVVEEELARVRNQYPSESGKSLLSDEPDANVELETAEASSAHDLAWAIQLKVRNSVLKVADDDARSSTSSLHCDLTAFMEDAF